MSLACIQEYEAVLDKWMAEFHYLLTYSNPALAESDLEKESVVDAVKAAVCENLYLFIQINEDEFEKYLKTFAQDVWTELTKVSLDLGQVSNIHALKMSSTGMWGSAIHHSLSINLTQADQNRCKIVTICGNSKDLVLSTMSTYAICSRVRSNDE